MKSIMKRTLSALLHVFVSVPTVLSFVWLLIGPADALSGPRRVLLLSQHISAVSSLPLDGISAGVKACYSTRKLLTAYAGKSMNVTRISDSTTADIGFVSNVFDTTSLNTFCSGTTCKVTTWYDQCGANNATNTAAGAPIIYQSGAVTTINGKPAPLFVSATPTLLNTSITANPVNTLYQNAVIIPSTIATAGITDGTGAGGGLEWRTNSGTGTMSLLKASTANIGTSSNSVTISVGAVVEAQYNSVTGAFAFWINRASGGTGTNIQTLTAATLLLGVGDSGWNGPFGEYISYDLVGGIPGASQTSIENNQKTYWGTP